MGSTIASPVPPPGAAAIGLATWIQQDPSTASLLSASGTARTQVQCDWAAADALTRDSASLRRPRSQVFDVRATGAGAWVAPEAVSKGARVFSKPNARRLPCLDTQAALTCAAFVAMKPFGPADSRYGQKVTLIVTTCRFTGPAAARFRRGTGWRRRALCGSRSDGSQQIVEKVMLLGASQSSPIAPTPAHRAGVLLKFRPR